MNHANLLINNNQLYLFFYGLKWIIELKIYKKYMNCFNPLVLIHYSSSFR